MPTSAVTGTHSVKTTGAKSEPVTPKVSKAKPAKFAKLVKAAVTHGENGFSRTRNVTNDEGHVVIQELQGKTWVDIEVRPKSDS